MGNINGIFGFFFLGYGLRLAVGREWKIEWTKTLANALDAGFLVLWV